MDSGNGSVERTNQHVPPAPGWAYLNINYKVPVELKYLISYLQKIKHYPSFAWTVRYLLETHPVLAELAADLIQSGKTKEPVTGDSSSVLAPFKH